VPACLALCPSIPLGWKGYSRFDAYMRLANICMGVRLTKLDMSKATFGRRLALLPHKTFAKPCKTWYLSVHLVVATTCDKQ
jgi:hypothetical protein